MSDQNQNDTPPPVVVTAPAPQAVTPASNQNLILGIVMGAVVLLLLLLVISQQFGKNDSTSEDQELIEQKRRLDELKERNDRLSAAGGLSMGVAPNELANKIKADTDQLLSLVAAGQANLDRLRDLDQTVGSLNRTNQAMQAEIDRARGAAARIAQLEAELKRKEGSISRIEADSLRNQITRLQADRDALNAQIQQMLASQGDQIDRNVYIAVKNERDDLLAENQRQRAEIQRLRELIDGARLFVKKDNLSPRAKALFRELERINEEDHRALQQTYRRIETQFNANVKEAITFPTGQSTVAREHEAHLKDVTVAAPANSFFLVVGYASKSGDSVSNQALSSKRATRVATMVNYLKKQGQEVQAVYLGETKRFGPTDGPNQLCEVWEIRP